VAFADDFSDGPEEDPTPPLLPREDRIWRHPSELGATGQSVRPDQSLVRRRWVASQPTRASAWTAGLVGAILATGVVALGTHLASAFTTSPAAATGERTAGPGLQPHFAGPPAASKVTATPASSALLPASASVTAMIQRVAASTATIEVSADGRYAYADALVMSANGDLVTPLSALAGATSVLVTPPGDSTYVGNVVATDANGGIAVLRVSNVAGLHPAPFAATTPVPGQLVFAVGRPTGPSAAIGMVTAVGETAGHAGWPVALRVDVPVADVRPGTPLVDDQGRILAIVTGSSSAGVLGLPSWLTAPVAADLATTGRVPHGWLDVNCETAYRHHQPVGAYVQSVLGPPALGELRANDVIAAIDGLPVTSYLTLQSRLYAMAPGVPVALSVERDGRPVTVDLRLGAGG
jgi:S1-C subfamily serine protease